MKLTPVMKRFILHWGEMGARWGVNRTVAQTHALLYLSEKPLAAEDIAETLSVSRSNVSQSLKELHGWGLVKIIHVLGTRRDHFESMKDPWEMFRTIINERKRREVDPTLAFLRSCAAEAGSFQETYTKERVAALLEFMETMAAWYGEMSALSNPAVVKFVKTGAKVKKMLGL